MRDRYRWLFAAMLLFIAGISYGLLVNRLGFFGDDWYIIWHLKVLGPNSFFNFFASERPFLAYLYAAITPWIGTAAIHWHIWGIFIRWLTALNVWWMLSLLWKKQEKYAMMAAVLFLVYPGFRQQYASVMYSLVNVCLLFELLSFSLMILFLRLYPSRWSWFAFFLSISFQFFNLFPMEYFFGFELLRPIILWLALEKKQESQKQRLFTLLKIWLPYLMVTSLFLYWRIFIFKFPTKYKPIFSTHDVSNLIVEILNVIKAAIDDFFDVSLFSWLQIFEPLKGIYNASFSTITSLVIGLIVIVIVATLFVYIGKQNDKQFGDLDVDDRKWARTALFIGLLSIFFMGIPFWFVGWQVDLASGENRFTLPFMLSVSLAMVSLLVWLLRKKSQQIIILSLLVGLSVAQHIRDANSYRLFHEAESILLQQFLWRAGDLKPGTVILINEYPTNFSSDTVLMSMINWVYDKNPSKRIKIGLFYLNDKRIGHQIPALEQGLGVGYGIRATRFQGTTSHALVAFYQRPGCLKIIDPERDYYSPVLPSIVQQASHLSNLNQIEVTSSHDALPADQFKYIPEKNWCYFYEKAELMSQIEQWQEVVKLGQEAERKGLKPEVTYEYFPFIEAYLITGKWEKAIELSRKIHRTYPVLQPNLCSLWDKVAHKNNLDSHAASAVQTAKDYLDCS